MDDYNANEEWGRYNYGIPQHTEPTQPTAQRPGDPGYRMSVWQNSYDPGPNWNNGIAPASSDPYSQYNGGSPVNAPLQAGYGWEWSAPFGGGTDPVWNMSTNNWDYGRWNQVKGRGFGLQDTPVQPPNPDGGRPDNTSDGRVNPVPPKPIDIPSATLPGHISAQFGKTPAKTPIQSAFQSALMDYMSRSQQTPSLDDPMLKPQAEVYRVQQQRNQERNRRNAVERAAATGQNQSGFVDRQINKGVQDQNFNTAAYNATLLGGEMDKRRRELQAALQLAAATGDQEAERELRTRLAEVSAALQQQGLNLQGQLGAGDLSLRLMQTLLGQDNFYDQLGVNTALNLEGLNQRALQSILGGG